MFLILDWQVSIASIKPRGMHFFYFDTTPSLQFSQGELIGGSQREERLDKLLEKMSDAGLEEKDYSWSSSTALPLGGCRQNTGFGRETSKRKMTAEVCGPPSLRLRSARGLRPRLRAARVLRHWRREHS